MGFLIFYLLNEKFKNIFKYVYDDVILWYMYFDVD